MDRVQGSSVTKATVLAVPSHSCSAAHTTLPLTSVRRLEWFCQELFLKVVGESWLDKGKRGRRLEKAQANVGVHGLGNGVG